MYNSHILYRALTPKKEWVYGVPMHDYMLVCLKYSWCENETLNPEVPDTVIVKILPETVGRYTGKHDMNGVYIFDGDKLSVHQGYDKVNNSLCIDDEFLVVDDFKNGDWSIKSENIIHSLGDWDFSNCMIIGNVYGVKNGDSARRVKED